MSDSAPLLNSDDEFNRRLLENVRPKGWTNPRPADRYNLVVIGGGTAGLVTAAGAAGLGARVALVERSLLGGDCLNSGCVPSKAVIASARAMKASGSPINDSSAAESFAAAMQRMRKLRAEISPHDSAERFRKLGVDVFFGVASFRDSETVEVAGTPLKFHRAVIATGARASAPPIPGLEQVSYLTNESLFELTELPRRLAIVGAGPIGSEMAQAFARLGSEVHLLDVGPRILAREDADAAEVVQRSLQRDGVRLHLGIKDLRVAKSESLLLEYLSNGGLPQSIAADRLLIAAGRAPRVEGLGLERVGVEFDRRGIRVDDYLRTTNKRIFAAGDVCSAFQFTHAADFMARIVIQNALFLGRKKFSSLVIPWCTYTSPELARVGLNQQEAQQQSRTVTTLQLDFTQLDRAILEGQPEGFARVHLRPGSDRILGATIVGEHAGELISEITLVMTRRLGLGAIGATIHPYPTWSDAVRKLADQYNRTRLTPRVKWAFEKWLAWRR
jgi:pyruvate/2-oxoglutarate dehydrogenase complex dihydrolipoamide dehydrogenase (E3) component